LSNGPEKHEILAGGRAWSRRMRRRQVLRLRDDAGTACVSALFFNAHDLLERYNMADTLKAQHTAYLTKGYVCYSDMGRILCSITEDTSGWHDTMTGVSNAAMVADKYGRTRFQEQRNGFYKNGYDGLLGELGKYGLGKRDIVANVNFFSKVTVDPEGRMHFQPGASKAGSYVDLRFEMTSLVALSTCQHPLDPQSEYRPRDVRLAAFASDPVSKEDPCRVRCPENERGFRNTEMLYLP
jgi:urea carboxylase-associated protein 2